MPIVSQSADVDDARLRAIAHFDHTIPSCRYTYNYVLLTDRTSQTRIEHPPSSCGDRQHLICHATAAIDLNGFNAPPATAAPMYVQSEDCRERPHHPPITTTGQQLPSVRQRPVSASYRHQMLQMQTLRPSATALMKRCHSYKHLLEPHLQFEKYESTKYRALLSCTSRRIDAATC